MRRALLLLALLVAGCGDPPAPPPPPAPPTPDPAAEARAKVEEQWARLARLHPEQSADSVDGRGVGRLYRAIRATLEGKRISHSFDINAGAVTLKQMVSIGG